MSVTNLSAEEQKILLDSYPTVKLAVAWVELIICGNDDGEAESSWELMTKCSPPLSAGAIRDVLRESIGELESGDCCFKSKHLVAAQMELPEFTTYLAGKMGHV